MLNKKAEIDRLVDALICVGAVCASGGRSRSIDELKLPLLRGLYRVAGVSDTQDADIIEEADELVCSSCGERYDADIIGKSAMAEHVAKHKSA